MRRGRAAGGRLDKDSTSGDVSNWPNSERCTLQSDNKQEDQLASLRHRADSRAARATAVMPDSTCARALHCVEASHGGATPDRSAGRSLQPGGVRRDGEMSRVAGQHKKIVTMPQGRGCRRFPPPQWAPCYGYHPPAAPLAPSGTETRELPREPTVVFVSSDPPFVRFLFSIRALTFGCVRRRL